MRRAWSIAALISLAAIAIGCERRSDDDDVVVDETAEPDRAPVGAQVERPLTLAPDEPPAKPDGAEPPVAAGPPAVEDPQMPRAMEFGTLDAPADGDLWSAPRRETPRGAFIVREGESYWVGGGPEAEAEAPADEASDAEARLAETEARVAEAEARLVEAEARLAEAEARLADAEAAAEESAARATTAGRVVTGVPIPSIADLEALEAEAERAQRAGSADDRAASAGLGRRGVSAQPGLGGGGSVTSDPAQPGVGQRGLSVEPGAGQRGLAVEPGLGQRGTP